MRLGFHLIAQETKQQKTCWPIFVLRFISIGKFCKQKLFWAISGSWDIYPGFFNFKIENIDIEDNIVEI